jgi:hypothetical protein
MICLSCPNCGSALEFADELAGFETACYACANPLKVPPAPVHPVRPSDPEPQPGAPPSPQWSAESTADRLQPDDSSIHSQDLLSQYQSRRKPQRSYGILGFGMGTRFLLSAIIVAIGVAGLYLSGGGVDIYVDNGGEEPMVVTVDGKEEATIAPGQFAKIGCQPGERRLQVRCGEEIRFDGIKNLEKLDRLGANRRYFFNPDNRNRYRTYTIRYGSSPLEGLIQFEQVRPVGEGRTAIRTACRELVAEAKLLPPESWFEVPDGAYVLTKAPDYVSTKRFTETRTVMTRVDPEDYAFIVKAGENKDPSEDDLKALIEVVDRVLESEP